MLFRSEAFYLYPLPCCCHEECCQYLNAYQSFLIKDNEVWEKYEQIWDVMKNKLKLSIKFHSKPIYDKKYSKAKVREFDG